ncbi:hypothetical protein SteCoe_1469 [Stentor coeruleus]|uniref:Protein kinase domain-containing protein n=1 Tax=Stentor coeruleus TaxID=5963 RepID=A0A1R2D1W2_9CILI|nr:hypothetical protein SteCoe_1469 [Stentor coeruleus]
MSSPKNCVCSSFGYGHYGQLGQPCQTFSLSPIIISIPEPITQISAGDGHTILLTESQKLYTFGKNTFGQLGLGHSFPISSPSLVSCLQLKKIESVYCGSEHTLALTNEGEIYSWGLNIKGQLGLGDTNSRNTPTLIESISSRQIQYQGILLEKGERVVQAACGGLHTLVLTDKNKILSCGHGNNYALGLGVTENVMKFTYIKSLEGLGKIDKIKAGLSHSAAIIQGYLYIWGKAKLLYPEPTQIIFNTQQQELDGNSPTNYTVEDVGLGLNYTLCINKGNLYAWGEGIGKNSKDPIRILCEKNPKLISCGTKHAVILSTDNKILVLGTGEYGQCGEVKESLIPTSLRNYDKSQVIQIACGGYHTVILSQNTPKTISCSLADNCAHSLEIQKLKLYIEEMKKKSRPEHKRGSSNYYLEKDPVKLAKNTKEIIPCFEIDYSELALDPEPIGRGGYGIVFKGKWRGTTVAIKKMKPEASADRYNDFIQECQTMLTIRHPNIILFMGACTIQPNICLILEYCGNGSLWDILRNHSTPLPWYLRCKISLDIAKGVNYLHNFPVPVLHLDLKSLNILLDDSMNAKIADFGWTRSKAELMTNKIGTYQWMAPEVIQGEEYTEKADVYSFGIILWEIATRKPPFRDLTGIQVSQEVVKNDLRPPVPKRCPDPFIKLMQKCWDRNPEARPDFQMIIGELENFLKFLERSSVS